MLSSMVEDLFKSIIGCVPLSGPLVSLGLFDFCSTQIDNSTFGFRQLSSSLRDLK